MCTLEEANVETKKAIVIEPCDRYEIIINDEEDQYIRRIKMPNSSYSNILNADRRYNQNIADCEK